MIRAKGSVVIDVTGIELGYNYQSIWVKYSNKKYLFEFRIKHIKNRARKIRTLMILPDTILANDLSLLEMGNGLGDIITAEAILLMVKRGQSIKHGSCYCLPISEEPITTTGDLRKWHSRHKYAKRPSWQDSFGFVRTYPE